MWVLGNLAGEGVTARDAVLSSGALGCVAGGEAADGAAGGAVGGVVGGVAG